ncbi:MAG TPA: hypothetical protein VEJ37_09690, partial [Xanthobacteraceae bacterium]|nr:hypothetical protein [Xanthobacteraceae bacterium]
STKMVHAALLLLMLEAVHSVLVFTISLKRSTQKSSAIHKLAGRLPHLWVNRVLLGALAGCQLLLR